MMDESFNDELLQIIVKLTDLYGKLAIEMEKKNLGYPKPRMITAKNWRDTEYINELKKIKDNQLLNF